MTIAGSVSCFARLFQRVKLFLSHRMIIWHLKYFLGICMMRNVMYLGRPPPPPPPRASESYSPFCLDSVLYLEV